MRWRLWNERLWFRATLYAILGVATALLAVFVEPFVPEGLGDRLGTGSAQRILTILATSLLAVATFSLGAMVTAYTSMAANSSPRVASIVTSDEGSQRALATFVGAFLYSMVAITAINANYYGKEGRAVIFIISAAVVVLVAVRLLAWMERLSRLATIDHIIGRVEDKVRSGMTAVLARRPLRHAEAEPIDGATVVSRTSGYVRFIDVDRLQSLAVEHDARIEVLVTTGDFVLRGEPALRLSIHPESDDLAERACNAITVGKTRTYEGDPRFGMVVLGQVAARALSPGVNDAGTAIDVIGTAARLLDEWRTGVNESAALEVTHDRVVAAALPVGEMIDDVFTPIARDGAADVGVAVTLQNALTSLMVGGEPLRTPLTAFAASALRRSQRAMSAPEDIARVEAAMGSPSHRA